ncbi:hypothetical protein [Actinokineospora inagensis]|uniref:hypothetical protein n=1 Tax=Actinokineospora inagensis TaxID=103730 RepID=UPI001FDF0FCE|nr:hypothetical protein [Actinokineospora inagensis]
MSNGFGTGGAVNDISAEVEGLGAGTGVSWLVGVEHADTALSAVTALTAAARRLMVSARA